jgi:hypothetical protein
MGVFIQSAHEKSGEEKVLRLFERQKVDFEQRALSSPLKPFADHRAASSTASYASMMRGARHLYPCSCAIHVCDFVGVVLDFVSSG